MRAYENGRAVGYLFDLELARHINKAHNGAVIASWQVNQLDDANYQLYRALLNREANAPKVDYAAIEAIEKKKQEYRKKFKRF